MRGVAVDAIVAGIAGKLLKKGGEKAVKKSIDKIIKYLKDDQLKSYALEERVEILLKQDDVCATSAWLWLHAPDKATKWATDDGSLEIDWSQYSLGLRLAANPFPASAHLWNGPDVIGDGYFAAMFASLFHDLIWGHADEIAKAFDVPRETVLRWGDGVLYAIWHTVEPGLMSRLAYGVCEFAVPWYHKLKRLFGFGCAALAFAGCAAFNPPNIALIEATGTNAIARAMQPASPASSGAVPGGGVSSGLLGSVAGEEPAATGAAEPASCQQVRENADNVDFTALSWDYGGFGGKLATLSDCRITDLKVSSGGLSYRWAEGGCEALGAANRGDASKTLACLFVLCRDASGAESWRGGKFDWISTNRTTRDFKNIKTGYHGWKISDVENATRYAFVIVDENGKRRSNVITCGR